MDVREAIARLDDDELEVLQVLSVLYGPVTVHRLYQACRDVGRWAHRKKEVEATVADLARRGLVVVYEEDRLVACARDVVELATRGALAAGRLERYADCVDESAYWGYRDPGELMGEFRKHLYLGRHWQAMEVISQGRNRAMLEVYDVDPLFEVCTNPWDGQWMLGWPDETLGEALWELFEEGVLRLDPVIVNLMGFVHEVPEGRLEAHRWMLDVMALDIMLVRGEASEVLAKVPEQDSVKGMTSRGWAYTLQGRWADAVQAYAEAERLVRKNTRKRKIVFPDVSGVFQPVCLLGVGEARKALGVARRAEKEGPDRFRNIYRMLAMAAAQECGEPPEFGWERALMIGEAGGLEGLFSAMVGEWMDQEWVHDRRRCVSEASQWNEWAQAECGVAGMEGLRARTQTAPLVRALRPRAVWERTLDALMEIGQTKKPATSKKGEQRLVWLVDFDEVDGTIEPRLQKRSKKGWTKGRKVALSRLHAGLDEPGVSDQDRRVARKISRRGSYEWNERVHYSLNIYAALPRLVGHPYVFRKDDPTVNVEVVLRPAQLRVERVDGEIWLSMEPSVNEYNAHVQWESPTRLVVTRLTKEQQRLDQMLQGGLRVPEGGAARVAEVVTVLSSMVGVESEGGLDTGAREVEADARVRVLLTPYMDGLQAVLGVRPLGDGTGRAVPGEGGETVLAEREGESVQTTRDLAAEAHNLDAVMSSCPTLALSDVMGDAVLIPDPVDALELLLELGELGERVVLEWPRGEKMRVRGSAGASGWRASVRSAGQWFEVGGELEVDASLVLEMSQLLAAVAGARGRFVPVGENEWVALTSELVHRLGVLSSLSQGKGKKLKLHPLAAAGAQEILGDASRLTADRAWKTHVARIREANELRPEVPATITAELREYQREGFEWLTRLAHWGAGACLADDMGLGKTLQALAVLVDRASLGPALVVAPTSVVHGWLDEAARFAPTLAMHDLRAGVDLSALGGGDVLMASYGLLHTRSEALSKMEFSTVVLDEAQAIKNMATKRSKAAMALSGQFRMITTGTPVENHLGELHNLMSFLNPGLLGSLRSFNERFAVPIEKHRDRQARTQLRNLVRPFLLRRTKSHVLAELPARTEILIEVELGEKERALYEALRIGALEELTSGSQQAGHIQILAQIMKLRRACCNPRLVTPSKEPAPPSAKLDELTRLLEDMRAGGHRALIFSQFVDHLTLIREHLDEAGISYQYLDGSTPPAGRRKAVKAFQSGISEVFLISLRAGGQGLNLTAADYVIHMDPWWNPAVEDQASDRAHRIGQTRPVTIYKLACKDTIEQAIVGLHRHKRQLAEDLLSGADAAARLDADELLALIRDPQRDPG